MAREIAVVTPTRNPVNIPGPTSTQMCVISRRVLPASVSTASRAGRTVSA